MVIEMTFCESPAFLGGYIADNLESMSTDSFYDTINPLMVFATKSLKLWAVYNKTRGGKDTSSNIKGAGSAWAESMKLAAARGLYSYYTAQPGYDNESLMEPWHSGKQPESFNTKVAIPMWLKTIDGCGTFSPQYTLADMEQWAKEKILSVYRVAADTAKKLVDTYANRGNSRHTVTITPFRLDNNFIVEGTWIAKLQLNKVEERTLLADQG